MRNAAAPVSQLPTAVGARGGPAGRQRCPGGAVPHHIIHTGVVGIGVDMDEAGADPPRQCRMIAIDARIHKSNRHALPFQAGAQRTRGIGQAQVLVDRRVSEGHWRSQAGHRRWGHHQRGVIGNRRGEPGASGRDWGRVGAHCAPAASAATGAEC